MLDQVQVDEEVAHFREMVGAYKRIGTLSGGDVPEPARFAGLLAAQAKIVERGEWTHGPSTLMAVLGLQRAEVPNCKVIRWLLDPLSPHGLGTEMLRALAVALEANLPNPAQAHVEAEVSRVDTRADVIVTGSSWTLVIEAKIDAAEGDRQGARLEEHWPEAFPFVFLTRSGTRRPGTAIDTTRWTSISWTWFADAAERLLATTETRTGSAERARHALREWIVATRSNLG
jgi:hypothetical protein